MLDRLTLYFSHTFPPVVSRDCKERTLVALSQGASTVPSLLRGDPSRCVREASSGNSVNVWAETLSPANCDCCRVSLSFFTWKIEGTGGYRRRIWQNKQHFHYTGQDDPGDRTQEQLTLKMKKDTVIQYLRQCGLGWVTSKLYSKLNLKTHLCI